MTETEKRMLLDTLERVALLVGQIKRNVTAAAAYTLAVDAIEKLDPQRAALIRAAKR